MPIDNIENDPTLRVLKTLVPTDVDFARAERVRGRCRAALRRRGRVERVLSMPAQRAVEFAVVSVLCGLYLVEVLRIALALLG